jgi:ribosomal peptide maturation radical SAM protein 1
MPWDALSYPSIRLGILKATLERGGIPTGVRSYHLALMEHFQAASAALPAADRLTVADYEAVSERFTERAVGEWIFAVPPYRDIDPAVDARYFEHLREHHWFPDPLLPKIERMRELVPAFLEQCADDLVRSGARVIGFTTSFSQNIPSLVLARMLKERAPALSIVFGGANCEGPMGAALHRSFPYVDVVVRGEAEGVVVDVVNDLLAGGRMRPRPGLCYREDGRPIAVAASGASSPGMETIPMPDYDEYFERLRGSPLVDEVLPKVRIPFEAARGCWWGEKSHCTFCGLNGLTMRFRSKPAEQVIDQLNTLAARHRWLDFAAVDNIIDMQYFQSVLPVLQAQGDDYRIFYETKANLKKHQVRAMRDAGVRMIQPGIETLSTPILRLMRKGVTAIQNVRLLKWAAQFGLRVNWNILYGFPREPVEEYARMAAIIPALVHLQPPYLGRVRVERFSPYFTRPAELGFTNLRPVKHYGLLYPVDAEALFDLAYDFDGDHEDGRDPDSYVGPLRKAVDDWRTHGAGSFGLLRYRSGPRFLSIWDRRTNRSSAVYNLDAVERHVYLACDGALTPDMILTSLRDHGHRSPSRADVQRILDELLGYDLLFREDQRYLSLALPADPDVDHVPAHGSIKEEDSEAQQATAPSARLVPLGRTAAG